MKLGLGLDVRKASAPAFKGLLDKFTGAVAAYSTRKLAASQQSAMQVRRAIDNETTNIGFVGKDLDTTALETFATESSPVLDDYTGAAAAYSLRKVRSAYTGDAIRVRRSSDNALQDIGFDANGDLDTAALTEFVGSQNLADWSENFGNFSSPSNVTLTSGVSDPFGGTDATELISSTDSWLLRDSLSQIQSGTEYTVSIYARAKTAGVKNRFRFIMGTASSSNIETTTTWTRYTATITANGTACGIYRTSPNSFAEIEIYGYQINEGTSAQSYATTSGTHLEGDGAVTTWYDQTQNDPVDQNNATQITADNQPLVVSGGTLVEENGKAAVEFSGNPVYLDASSAISDAFTGNSVYYKFEIAQVTSTSKGGILSANTGYRSFFNPPSYDYANFHNPNGLEVISSLNVDRTNQFLFSESFDANTGGGTYELYGNGTLERSQGSEGTSNLDTPTSVYIGRDPSGGSSGYLVGKIQEIIFFNSDQSGNRTGIEGNIGRYYNIDGFRDVFVSKWYDQSGNFNHAENSTESEQPLVVSGGTLVEENGKAAVDFDGVTQVLQNSVGASDLSNVSIFLTTGIRQLNDDATIITYPDIGNNGGVSIGQGGLGTNAQIGLRYRISATDIDTDGIALTTGQKLLSALCTSSTTAELFENGTAGALSVSARLNFDNFEIGAAGNSAFHFDGTIQEVVIFESDQSSNREDIENNINKHFKIYEE